MSSPTEQTPRPGRWWGRPLAETRWTLEASRLLIDPVMIGHGIPRGDGRPVVLVPGFLAGDQTLLVLAGWLRAMGYAPRLAGFRFNVDCSDRTLDDLEALVDRLHVDHGRRLALIGHSRGGHLVRALAARRPDAISHAISMGADLQDLFGISAPTRTAVGLARKALHHTDRARDPACFRRGCACSFMRDYRLPFPTEAVRLTSIYSRGDGVVRWSSQVVPEATCVEVTGSHIGLVFNRKSYRAIAAALAEPEL